MKAIIGLFSDIGATAGGLLGLLADGLSVMEELRPIALPSTLQLEV